MSHPNANAAPLDSQPRQHAAAPLDDKAYNNRIEDIEADEKGLRDNVNDSEAAKYLDHTVIISPQENKRLKRMIDLRILPLLCLAYFAQAMDKGATSPISIMGWMEDVGMQGQDFALASTVL
jgi:hypothetical protein